MNKYTLIFLDPILESRYQEQIKERVYPILFFYFHVCTLLLMIIKVIDGLINTNQSQFTLKVAFTSYLLVQFVLISKWKKHQVLALVIANHFLMFFQISQRTNEVQHTFLFGQNNMIVHSIIMIMLDYKEGMITNLTFFIIRINIAQSKENIDYQDYIYVISSQLLLAVCLYYKNLHQRESFLLTLKDFQWDLVIPQLVSKPAFIFTFNSEQVKFISRKEIKIDFISEKEEKLIHFLRESILENKQNLEQFIFNRIKRYANNFTFCTSKYLNVNYKGQRKHIVYNEFYIEQLTFSIILESDDTMYQQIQLNEKYKSDNQNKVIQNYLYQSILLLNQITHSKQYHLLCYLRNNYLKFYYQIQLQNKQLSLQTVNLKTIFVSVISIYKQMGSKCKLQCQKNIKFICNKPQLMLFILEIINNIQFFDTLVILKIGCINDQISLVIQGNFNYSYQSFKQNSFKGLIHTYQKMPFCNILQLYLDHIFQFENTPFIPFEFQI